MAEELWSTTTPGSSRSKRASSGDGAPAIAQGVGSTTVRLPLIRGVIERRILVNYRVDPVVLARILPAPFRPKLHRGHGMVGICLIRMRGIRPRYVPSWLGIASENAAHRTAVEWDEA